MKVLVLGGCGGMGRCAVDTLLTFAEVSSVVVGDINLRAAQAQIDSYGDRVSAVKVDVSNPDSLANALAGVDLAMNAVGPFYRFGRNTLQACIERRVNYIDICDDWEPTLDMLKLHKAAEKAGITAIIGMGATPGMSNLLAKKIVREYDCVDSLYTGWNVDYAVPEEITEEVSAATIHGVQQLTGTIQYLQNGVVRERKPLTKFKVEYPGLGRKTMRAVGHPEPITFAHYFPNLKNSVNVFFASPSTIFLICTLARLVDWKLMSARKMAEIIEREESKKRGGVRPEEIDVIEMMDHKKEFPAIFVVAEGVKRGKRVRTGGTIRYFPPGGMGGATGVPFAVAAAMLARGSISKRGVYAPEGCIDPDEFFNTIAPHCGAKGVPVEALTQVSTQPC